VAVFFWNTLNELNVHRGEYADIVAALIA